MSSVSGISSVLPALTGGGKRTRRVGIVALARRLLVALWRYLEDGALPDGARLIPATVHSINRGQ